MLNNTSSTTASLVMTAAALLVACGGEPTEREKAHAMVDQACEGVLAEIEGACEYVRGHLDTYFDEKESFGLAPTAEKAHAYAMNSMMGFQQFKNPQPPPSAPPAHPVPSGSGSTTSLLGAPTLPPEMIKEEWDRLKLTPQDRETYYRAFPESLAAQVRALYEAEEGGGGTQ